MKYKTILFDLDGTLTRSEEGITRSAIYAAEKMGFTGYTKEQVLFMGDDMGDGGGDSHVRLGGMDYIHVLDFTKISEMLAFLLEE